MTKRELFVKAHEMTREIVKETGVNYRTQFGICLSFLYKEEKEMEEKKLEIGTWNRKFEVIATEKVETSEGSFNMPIRVFDKKLETELTFGYKVWEKYNKTRIYFSDDANGFVEIKNGEVVATNDSAHCAAGRAFVRAVAECLNKLKIA